MAQQNDNSVTLTWLKKTLSKWESPAHTPHELPACKIFPFSIHTHTPHGKWDTSYNWDQRNLWMLGGHCGNRPSVSQVSLAAVTAAAAGLIAPKDTHTCIVLCMSAIQQTEFFSPSSLQPYRVKLLMEKERKLSLTSDWHSCRRSHRIFNNYVLQSIVGRNLEAWWDLKSVFHCQRQETALVIGSYWLRVQLKTIPNKLSLLIFLSFAGILQIFMHWYSQ